MNWRSKFEYTFAALFFALAGAGSVLHISVAGRVLAVVALVVLGVGAIQKGHAGK